MERGRGNHGDVGFVMTPTILSAGAAVAALTYRLLSGNQVETAEREDRRPCGKCGGTGYVECFCTRWDYSAASGVERAGCNTCHGSLRERCPGCNGSGGLKVQAMQPAVIPARVNRGSPYKFSVAPFSLK